MTKISILLNKKNTIKLDVEIDGVDKKDVKPRLSIKHSDFQMVFEGKMDDSGVVFDVPELKNHMIPDDYKAEVEFIVDGSI